MGNEYSVYVLFCCTNTYRIGPNRCALHECMSWGAHMLISQKNISHTRVGQSQKGYTCRMHAETDSAHLP